jgi:hypothetical protein
VVRHSQRLQRRFTDSPRSEGRTSVIRCAGSARAPCCRSECDCR